MLTPWANHAAIVAFGIIIGALGYVQTLLTPASYRAAQARRRETGEGYVEHMRHVTDEANAILAAERARSKAFRNVSYAVPAVVVVLILMIVLSPVEMEWWWLIGSLFVGGFSAAGVARLARSGRFDDRSWAGTSGAGLGSTPWTGGPPRSQDE